MNKQQKIINRPIDNREQADDCQGGGGLIKKKNRTVTFNDFHFFLKIKRLNKDMKKTCLMTLDSKQCSTVIPKRR